MLQARAKRHRVENFSGPLSIKTVLTGQVEWVVERRPLRVDQLSFLILNAGERYSLFIDQPTPVETCCVFFAPGFVERIALDVATPLERALEAPDRQVSQSPYLSALHQDRHGSFGRQVKGLAPRCRLALAPSGFEEDFILLARQTLGHYRQVCEQAARLPAARHSTRQELFRRLLIGREFMHSQSTGPTSLRAAAHAACLSPYHFHRGFTKAFGQTPHTYITELRLGRTRTALESGATVLEACQEAGFASPSAFSRLFRSRYGELPSAVKRNSQDRARKLREVEAQ